VRELDVERHQKKNFALFDEVSPALFTIRTLHPLFIELDELRVLVL
jgi:hypothetical protein